MGTRQSRQADGGREKAEDWPGSETRVSPAPSEERMMDSRKVLDIIGKHYTGQATGFRPRKLKPVGDALQDAAEEIAQAHKGEKRGWMKTLDSSLDKITQLRAKVAMTSGALDRLCKAAWWGTDETRQAAYDKAQQALASAPTVVWSGKAQVLGIGGPITPDIHESEGSLVAYLPEGTDTFVGALIDVYACSVEEECLPAGKQRQNSEQGYKAARGVIPWQEGDELPEDTIARIRGRGGKQSGKNALQPDSKAQEPDGEQEE